jgi:hypothetical protein
MIIKTNFRDAGEFTLLTRIAKPYDLNDMEGF